jgi:hypothetical protein
MNRIVVASAKHVLVRRNKSEIRQITTTIHCVVCRNFSSHQRMILNSEKHNTDITDYENHMNSKDAFRFSNSADLFHEKSSRSFTTKKNTKSGMQHKKHRRKNDGTSIGPTTSWICVKGAPPLSTLDDLLREFNRVMTVESKLGIVDLDKAEQQLREQINIEPTQDMADNKSTSPTLPLWDPNSSLHSVSPLPSHMVLEAHMMLSTLGRPNGWFLRLPNRSCVHAILSHIGEAKRIFNEEKELVTDTYFFPWKTFETRPLLCGGRELTVEPFYPSKSRRSKVNNIFNNPLKWGISDNVIRMENCVREATEDDVANFFYRYNLLDERKGMLNSGNPMKSVQLIVQGASKDADFAAKTAIAGERDDEITLSATSTFLVRFASAADARSAVRDKQNVEFMGRRLRLAQYSRQILN